MSSPTDQKVGSATRVSLVLDMGSYALERFGTDPRQTFLERLEQIERRISSVCAETGRDRSSVRLLPITKTVPADILRHAYDAGLRDFAENKVQEAQRKSSMLCDLPIRWSIVGHLQTNKVKKVINFINEFHALDNLRLADQLNRELAHNHLFMDIYIQVNTSGEESKYGLTPEALPPFIEALGAFEHLRPRGLMTLAIFSSDRDRVCACFRLLRDLRDQAVARHPEICELSMGMSGDFEDAIRNGANVVRIGQAIFGKRPTSDDHYWPVTRSHMDPPERSYLVSDCADRHTDPSHLVSLGKEHR